MSEDKHNEEEEQERKNEFFDDGDDFGLPDLDYDELDEGEEEEPLEEEINFDIQSDSDVGGTSYEEGGETSFDSGEDTSYDFEAETTNYDSDAPTYDEESLSTDDLSAEDFEISDEELEGIDLDSIDVDNLSDDDTTMYGEDSFSDFEPDPEAATFAAETSEAAVAAENYKELSDRENTGSQYRYSDEQSRSSFTRIVIIGTIVIVALGGLFWWFAIRGGGEEQQAAKTPEPAPKQEQPKPKPVAKDTVKEAATPPPRRTPPPQQAKAQPVAANPGEIKTVTARTGNSYIIIGSFVDSDLANDYAKKLADSGESPTIIAPPGAQLFYRVAIASFNSYEEASSALNDFKPDYGDDTWALRY